MTHFALLWKARTIEKYRQNYEKEKHNSIIMSNADIPNKTFLQRWRHYSHDVQKHLSRTFSNWYPEGTTMSNILVNFRAEMRFPHILLRSLFGFVGGLMLTYLCFVFLVFQLFLPLVHATVLSSLFGVLITLGLTFSNRIRCLVFLLIPQLFSRAGRYTLTCYALVLILTGPATNTLKNSEVLSESMACSQEQIKTSVRDINQSVTKPFNSIKGSIKLMVEEMKRITLKLRSVMLRVNRLILSIASLIQSNFSWLGSITQTCNDQLGSPYHRCLASLNANTENFKDCETCYEKAPWYHATGPVGKIAQVACEHLKPYEKFCVASDFVEETFYATVRRKLKLFTDRISEALYLKIHTRHSYTFIGNTSSPSQVAAGIVTEIRNRADPILTWLSWSSCVTSLFLLLIIFRAKYYQHMYETRSRFDNRYITKEFRELDLKRLREGRETVLPLSRRERAKYVTTTSFRLVASEKIYLNRSAIFMTITSFKLLIHIVADYSLYWVLMTIQHHGKLQSTSQHFPTTGVHITGTGFVSNLIQALLNTLNIPLIPIPLSTSCLPKPHPPDCKRYSQIGTIIFLLWVLNLFEPYGLRLRHLIMGHYKPERAKTRAAWLYNHILRTRGSFMKFARRKLHREYKYRPEIKLTFRYWLRSLVPFQWLRCLLGVQLEEPYCLLCSTVEDVHGSNTKLIRCATPNCVGTYCVSCFSDIGQMCTICLSPKDYGDLSDVSLEKGSSDEDEDGDYRKGGNASNNKNASNEFTDTEGSSNHDGNFKSKYESYNESEHSDNSKAKGHDTFRLISHHNEIANEKIDATIVISTMTEPDKYSSKKTYQIARLNDLYFELFKCVLNVDTASCYIQNTSVFYSFYRINIHKNMSFVVTKNRHMSKLAKTLRKKITKSTKKKNLIVTCTKDNKESTQKIKRKDQKNEEPNFEKNEKNEKQQSDNLTNNNKNDDKTQKSKKQQLQDNRILVTNMKSNPRIDKFHAKCSRYWKNISNALSCTDISDTINDLPVIDEKKHKRKKKQKKCKDKLNKCHKIRNNNEDARQYRISSYLADQDWKKKDIDDKVIDSSSMVQTVRSIEENEIEVNHIRIPRLNLHFSSESLNNTNLEGKKIEMCKAYHAKRDADNGFKKKSFNIGLFEKFMKRTSSSSIAIDSPEFILEEEIERKFPKTPCNSDFNMPRSMKYFHSLGNGNDYQQHQELFQESVCNDMLSQRRLIFSSEISKTESIYAEKLIRETCIGSMDDIIPKHQILCPNTKVSKEKITVKKSLQDLTKKFSNIKRQSSEKILGFRNPLTMWRDICNSLLTGSEHNFCNTLKSKKHRTQKTADKGVAAYPLTSSCGCQNSQNFLNQAKTDCCLQVDQKMKQDKRKMSSPVRNSRDMQVNTANQTTCTCATQYYAAQRDVGTLKTQTTYRVQDSTETLSEDSIFSVDSDSSTVSKSDVTQTNTTVCSLATIDYRKADKTKGDKKKRLKVEVVTKANRSTLTEKTDVCDVSTVTFDWWSPIVEKKDYMKEITLEKKAADLMVVKEKRKRYRNKGVITDGRIVTFRSRAQIIPNCPGNMIIEDILSPSRYLLESQKYYNELYASKLYSPHVFPVTRILKHQKLEPRSPNRRGRRTKRLEECYTRKQILRKKHSEFLKAPESTLQVRQKRNSGNTT